MSRLWTFWVEGEEYLVAELSQVWGLLCQYRSRSLLSASLQQTQDGMQAAPRTSQHTCNTRFHCTLRSSDHFFYPNQNPTYIPKITTASKINLSNTKSRGLTWVLEVGGRHRLLDFIAQKIQGQVGRLQLQGGDEQIQDMDLGFVSDFRNLLLLVRV